jgi:hypothetical protein
MKEKKIVVKIPVQGSLGLLALGHRGVTAWRKVRDEENAKQAKKEEKKDE